MSRDRKLWLAIAGCLLILLLALVLFKGVFSSTTDHGSAVVEGELEVVPEQSQRPTLPPELADHPEFRNNDPNFVESLGVSVAYVKEHGITEEQIKQLSMADAHDLFHAGVFYEQAE